MILLDGVNESQPGFTMNPYRPTKQSTDPGVSFNHGANGYCPESWHEYAFGSHQEAEADFAMKPNGPWSFFHKWNFGEVDSGGNMTSQNPDGSIPNMESMPRALSSNIPGVAVGGQTHSFMLDALAAQGSIILPFSYRGFGFAPDYKNSSFGILGG